VFRHCTWRHEACDEAYQLDAASLLHIFEHLVDCGMPTSDASKSDSKSVLLEIPEGTTNQAKGTTHQQARTYEQPLESRSPPEPAVFYQAPSESAESLAVWCYMSPDEQWQGPFTAAQLRTWRGVLPMDLWLCQAHQLPGALARRLLTYMLCMIATLPISGPCPIL